MGSLQVSVITMQNLSLSPESVNGLDGAHGVLRKDCCVRVDVGLERHTISEPAVGLSTVLGHRMWTLTIRDSMGMSYAMTVP